MLSAFVEKHHGEDVIVDQLFYPLRDAAKKLLAVQDGSDFATDFVQEGKRVGLLGIGHKQARGDGISFTHQRKGGEFGGFIHTRSIRGAVAWCDGTDNGLML